ncbi:MAG TPA: hypothetical protein VIJ09_04300, partial [Acidimicrobiales bacterium]
MTTQDDRWWSEAPLSPAVRYGSTRTGADETVPLGRKTVPLGRKKAVPGDRHRGDLGGWWPR